MKTKLLNTLTVLTLVLMPGINFGQAPNLGKAGSFVLFSSNGATTNTGISQLTGDVGAHTGSVSGFGNVNGSMHSLDTVSGPAVTDLLAAYTQLNGTTATLFPAPALGGGDTLKAGVYSITAAATVTGNLYLDAKGVSGAVFIFKIEAPLSTATGSKIKLINGAQACNVFWKVNGLVSMGAKTSMKGTVIAHNAAIVMMAGDTLEGRALSTTGNVTVDGILGYTPTCLGSPPLTGPTAPVLGAVGCYALFSGNGALTNAGVTTVKGDVGTNVGLTTGFDPLKVTGSIHPIPDGSTAACKAGLLNVYTYLNTMTADIKLLYPAQFGRNLVLTPHAYIMEGAVTFTDSLYLDARGNSNAVFVIKVKGAFTTSVKSKVILINGTQEKNVYWMVDGEVAINDYSIFNGTIVCANGAIALNTGVQLNGRALTTVGQFNTAAATVIPSVIPSNCGSVGIQLPDEANAEVSIYPNPFSTSPQIIVNNVLQFDHCVLKMYTVLGAEVMSINITNHTTTLETDHLPKGIYFYKLIGNNKIIQSGKLVSQQ